MNASLSAQKSEPNTPPPLLLSRDASDRQWLSIEGHGRILSDPSFSGTMAIILDFIRAVLENFTSHALTTYFLAEESTKGLTKQALNLAKSVNTKREVN